MRAESQNRIAAGSCLANGGFPVNARRSCIYNNQRRFLFPGGGQSLLESRERANCFDLHIVMPQGIAHLHRKEEVFLQREYMCSHNVSNLIVWWLVHRSAE